MPSKRIVDAALDADIDDARAREQHAWERKLTKLGTDNLRLKKQLRLIANDLEAEYKRSGFLDATGHPFSTPWKPRKARHGGQATAILLYSDWHVEETVRPEVVNGMNSYNLSICEKRVKKTNLNAAVLIDLARKLSNIQELCIWLGGDFISGTIHEELLEDNSLSPIKASLFAQDQLVSSIDFLLKETKIPRIVIPTSVGNHGRTTQKIRFSTEAANSYEWLMYHQLERYYRSNSRVQFKIEEGYLNWLDLQGHKCRFHHGHRCRFKGGRLGPGNALANTKSKLDDTQRADHDFMGHLHTHFCMPGIILNNSMIGFCAFSIAMGYSPPSQTLVVLDKKQHSPVWVQEIFCE